MQDIWRLVVIVSDGEVNGKSAANLQFASGSQVVEHLDDVLGQRGRSGQMISLGLESILIGHPGDGVSLAIFGERVAALRHGSRLFGFGSDLLLDSALADDDSVLRLVAERVHLFLRVVVLRLLDDEDGTVVLGGGGGNGQEHGDQDHLQFNSNQTRLVNHPVSSCVSGAADYCTPMSHQLRKTKRLSIEAAWKDTYGFHVEELRGGHWQEK